MNETNHDDELRDALRALGDDAARRAPAFQQVWRKAFEAQTTGRSDAWHGPMKWALPVAILAIAGLMILMMPHQRDTNTIAVSHYDATAVATDAFDQSTPTDFLLTDRGEAGAPPVEELSREINALLHP